MKEGFTELPESYWYDTMTRIREKFAGKNPSPMQIRAEVLLELAGIPSGQYSALKTETDENGETVRTDPEGDKIIAEKITNKAGLLLSGTEGITSRDLRDRYPDGLPDDVLAHLDEKTKKIIQAMYAYEKYVLENNTEDSEYAINMHFLPGGIPYVSVGVQHTKNWMNHYSRFMKEIGKEAEIISIEGYADEPLGGSLKLFWNGKGQDNGFGGMMRNIVREGYGGYFAEIDGRDDSRIAIDSRFTVFQNLRFSDLADSFYRKYLEYLKKENPKYGENIGTPERLKSFLKKQSVAGVAYKKGRNYTVREKKEYPQRFSFTDTEEKSAELTGNELGELIFADALASIKLHLLGKMMNDGILPKGAIVDYEGTLHLSSKSFFVENPEYAMEIVLRTLPNLLAGTADDLFFNYLTASDFAERVFDHTDWERAIREIFRIPLKKIADPKSGADGVENDENQRPMIEAHTDEYVLEKTLASQKPGKRKVKDWVNEMETLIKKFA
jgi:hypothetical protein